jgi:tetratricopeptide (TPR) repeat protein
MAYVRRRGNQLAIVHGEREPGTGKVQQRILFTIYSKAEAREILGRGERRGRWSFEGLFRRQFPEVKVNWAEIRRGLEDNLGSLPDLHEYRSGRLRERFRESLCTFTKQLLLADPQDLMSSAHLIQEHRHELEYLADRIAWRLKLRDQEQSEWNEDNPFYWRFALQGRMVPPDTEEHAAGFYERGEYEEAEAVFRLLVDCFDGYAEGYNYLGLIAYQQGKLEAAIGHFERTIELGRKLFPARISKKRYWSDHATRPYMRGLQNLALALNETARYDEALAVCDRLEGECGDDLSATSHRAAISLNTRQWEQSADLAKRSGGDLDPSAGFVEAFALFELGRYEEALPAFLRAAIHFPRAARMLAGERTAAPRSYQEAKDHNTGVACRRSLHAYLAHQPPAARKFFRALVRDPRVAKLIDESIAVVRRWQEEHHQGDRSAFDRMTLMRSRPFALGEARKLYALLPRSGHQRSVTSRARPAARNGSTRSRT